MDSMEERMGRLEKRVRGYRVLTVTMIAILLLIFGWVGYGVWRLMGIQEIIGPPLDSRDITIRDERGHPQVSLTATGPGWALQMQPEIMITPVTAETRGLGKRTESARLAFSVSGGTPVLTMTDKDGREVWRAP